jgi:hypothetical protein
MGSLSPEAAATIRAAEQHRTRWLRGEAPAVDPRFGAITIDQIAVGYHIKAKVDGPVADIRMRSDGQAKQGIIVATHTVPLHLDDDTVNEPAYTVIDPDLIGSPRARGTILRRQIDTAQLKAFDVGKVRALVRAVLRDIVDNGPTKGPIPDLHRQLLADVNHLLAVLDQKDTHR